MRMLATTLVLASLAGLAGADEPPRLTLAIGEEKTPLGIMPRCDDLAVVAITADGRGVKGLRPGETICSFDRSGGGGARQVYRIVVVAPKSTPAAAPDPARPGGQ
jgi:hypothetical protein